MSVNILSSSSLLDQCSPAFTGRGSTFFPLRSLRPSRFKIRKKQAFLPNKANFFSVKAQITKPIQSQTNPILSHIKANMPCNKANFMSLILDKLRQAQSRRPRVKMSKITDY
ncbi:MAG: hypothetical protein WCD79_00995 [Chthoniobacteraceae bacterium]